MLTATGDVMRRVYGAGELRPETAISACGMGSNCSANSGCIGFSACHAQEQDGCSRACDAYCYCYCAGIDLQAMSVEVSQISYYARDQSAAVDSRSVMDRAYKSEEG
jgi:hypothetical protein